MGTWCTSCVPSFYTLQGFISTEDFLTIPELSINPLAQRLSFLVESINFKDFVVFLSRFSSKASQEEKLRGMFDVYDVDGAVLVLMCVWGVCG